MKNKTLRSLDDMDSMLDIEFSNDKAIRIGIHSKLKKHSKRTEDQCKYIKETNNSTMATDQWRIAHAEGIKRSRETTDLNQRQAEINRAQAKDPKWINSVKQAFQQPNNKTNPIKTDQGKFVSVVEAARQLNIHRDTVRNRIKSGKYYYITWEEYNEK